MSGPVKITVEDFKDWRAHARLLIANHITPAQITWQDKKSAQNELWDVPPKLEDIGLVLSVPPNFMALAKRVACHRDSTKWSLLYKVLWQIAQGEKRILEVTTDDTVFKLNQMSKAVSRDAHKTKAFVRFRKIEQDGVETFIAWHQPDHFVLPLVAPFFRERFSIMNFAILTPDQSMIWDGKELVFGEGVPRSAAPQDDEIEDLWLQYYRSIFNPARIKIKMMKSEMPVRHWATLPEARIIPDMLAEAPQRVAEMIKRQGDVTGSAADFLPDEMNLDALSEAAKTCKGCELYKYAHQVVFGDGPRQAKLMLVGEQPGDKEDIEGYPFVGPAGKILDKALAEAGIDRNDVYLTNAVKHFKFRMAGKRREHRSPLVREVVACKPWLEAEMAVVKPKLIVCLGVTAARSLLGAGFTLKEGHGRWHGVGEAQVCATYHPSAVLRSFDSESGQDIYEQIVKTLKDALKKLRQLA